VILRQIGRGDCRIGVQQPGFERRFNGSFAIEDEEDFVAAMVRDISSPPPNAAATRAANLGRSPVGA
jgi:hypothetical protein